MSDKDLQKAKKISLHWGERLDEFKLPCPLCRGEMEFQGVFADKLYEFAEGEPGVVHPLDVQPISFVCNRCGYNAEFDSELFNPAHLARLQNAEPDLIEELSLRHYRVLVPMTGKEHTDTLLDIATTIAGEQRGEVLIFDTSHNSQHLQEKLQNYTPRIGDPAPVRQIQQAFIDLGGALVEVVNRERCNLMVIDADLGMRHERKGVRSIVDHVVTELSCDVIVVHDRGLERIRRILLVTDGGQNARAATPYAVELAYAYSAELHFLYVASPNQQNPHQKGLQRINNMLHHVSIPEKLRLESRILVSDKLVQTIVEESTHYDLTIVGGSPRNWRGQIRPESVSAKVARNSSSTVLIVRARGSQLTSWINLALKRIGLKK